MSTAYGVTPTGFVSKPLSVIKAEMEARVTDLLGASFDVSTESPAGQWIGIVADLQAEGWDADQAVYAANTPDGAAGVSLDNVCALTGTKRDAASFSTVTATLTGTPTSVISPATFGVAGTSALFLMNAGATIAAATAWVASTVYATAGVRRTNGGNIYRVVTPGTAAGSVGPTGTGSAITDGSVVWAYVGAGTGYVDALCTATTTGPLIAVSGTLTVISTPRAGLTSVNNTLDAVLGSNVEDDPPLRVRREAELRKTGNAATEAIRGKILALKDANGAALVTACTVFENTALTTDGSGLPGKSIQVLATCATGSDIDLAVATAIYQSKGGGIQAYGGTVVTVTDSQGNTHSIGFDRPTQILVYARYDLIIDPLTWPVDGVAQVQAAAVAYGLATLTTGRDVVASAVGSQAFKVAGVLDSPAAKIGTAPSPTLTATIVVTSRQIALLDTSRITVFTTPGTP